jgi:hypothetical protein
MEVNILFRLAICLCVWTMTFISQVASGSENVVIVANLSTQQSSQLPSLDRQALRNIFLGGVSSRGYLPVGLTPEHEIRQVFNVAVIGLSESRIQSYWAQMRFSGRNKPPPEFATVSALLDYIRNTPNAIGYVPANTEIPSELIVVYVVN